MKKNKKNVDFYNFFIREQKILKKLTLHEKFVVLLQRETMHIHCFPFENLHCS